jgi:hypothetical protein
MVPFCISIHKKLMLPPRLQQVKDRIERKTWAQRSEEEKQLLKELEFLDRRPEMREILNEGVRKSEIIGVVSGPGGGCPCCGK